MLKKIVGWGLLVAGIILIVWTLYSSYNIFTGETSVPKIFEMPIEKPLTQTGGDLDIQAQVENMIGDQLKGMLPVGAIVTLLNLSVWSMLAFILIFGATQISSLGIKLIRV